MSLMKCNNSPAQKWSCLCQKSVSGLPKILESWVSLKNVQIFKLELKCSDIKDANWIHYFFFIVMVKKFIQKMQWVVFISWLRFCSKFSRIALFLEPSQLDSKTALSANGWIFLVLCCNILRFVVVKLAGTNLCMHSPCVVHFSGHIVYSSFTLWGILVCSSNVNRLFSNRAFYDRLKKFINALQLCFLCFLVFRPLLWQVVINNSSIVCENQLVCFTFFLEIVTVSWCSTLFSTLVIFWIFLMKPTYALARWGPCCCWKCISGLQELEKAWNFSNAFKTWTWSSDVVQT